MVKVDAILEDDELVELVNELWGGGIRRVGPRGSKGTPSDVAPRPIIPS
jgi:hypothetical protein